jgi:hypothetical protein
MYTQLLLAVLHCVISLVRAEVSTVPSIVVCAHVHTCIRVRLCTALLPLTTAAAATIDLCYCCYHCCYCCQCYQCRLGTSSRKTVPSDTALLPYMFRGQNYRPSSHPDDPLVPVEPIARTEPDAPPRGCMLSHSSLVANLCQIEEPEGRHVSIGVTGKSLFDRCAAVVQPLSTLCAILCKTQATSVRGSSASVLCVVR